MALKAVASPGVGRRPEMSRKLMLPKSTLPISSSARLKPWTQMSAGVELPMDVVIGGLAAASYMVIALTQVLLVVGVARSWAGGSCPARRALLLAPARFPPLGARVQLSGSFRCRCAAGLPPRGRRSPSDACRRP